MKMNKNNIYKCVITTGGGTEQDGGDFEIKETEKMLYFICVREPFFSSYNGMIDKKHPVNINKYYRKSPRPNGNLEAWRDMETPRVQIPYRAYMNNGHVARKWEDGTWTVYPNQSGIPHYLEPLHETLRH